MSFENCTAGQRGGGFYLGSVGPGDMADQTGFMSGLA